MTTPTLDLLAPDTVWVTDGGLATQLEAMGHDLTDALWSARLLRDDPGAIVEAHLAFLRAGARVVTTASYQASYTGFAAAGIEADEATRLLLRSVELAREARDRYEAEGGGGPRRGGRAVVAASVGPYGASLADGSEYRGRYGLSVGRLRDWHARRVEVLAGSGADVLAVETIPDADEARAILDLVRGGGVPAWLSYTVEDGRTRAGQPWPEAFAVAADAPEVIAVGVNCCAPGDVLPAARTAREVTGLPVVAYPNSGEGWDAAARSWTGTAASLGDLAPSWIQAGVRLVGGCCRVGPEQIAELARVAARVRTP
ncbi:homocysteine S-methyltransferase [Mobilicoccus sp.]|uniref:homocysteine S-methyltransferase n=1 Tax=Mobilicoccus sp. TaxID=2034349 RepID=UPI0028AAB5E7|nr:homocysteine S-methyltransferase [Mobilicoccus sp.]